MTEADTDKHIEDTVAKVKEINEQAGVLSTKKLITNYNNTVALYNDALEAGDQDAIDLYFYFLVNMQTAMFGKVAFTKLVKGEKADKGSKPK